MKTFLHIVYKGTETMLKNKAESDPSVKAGMFDMLQYLSLRCH